MIESDINEQMANFSPTQNADVGIDRDVDPVAADMASKRQLLPDPMLPKENAVPDIDPDAAAIAARRNNELMASMMAASQTNPVEAAKALKLGEKFGVGTDMALRNQADLERMDLMNSVQRRNLMQRDPVLARYLTQRDFAAIAHDDIDNLSAAESIFNYVRRIPSRIETGLIQAVDTAERGEIYTRQRAGEFRESDKMVLDAIKTELANLPQDTGFIESAAQFMGIRAEMAPTMFRRAALGTVVGAAMGGPAGAAIGMGVGLDVGSFEVGAEMEGGNAYGDMKEAGYDDSVAVPASVGVGVINGALELVGGKILTAGYRYAFKSAVSTATREALVRPTTVAALKTLGVGYAKGIAGETATEVSQEIVTIAGDEIARYYGSNLESRLASPKGRKEIANRLVETAVQTAMGMAVIGAGGPAAQFYVDQSRANAANKAQSFFENLNNNVVNSEVRNRNADAYERFIASQAEGTGAETIYVDAREMADVLRQSELTDQEMDSVLPGLRQQLEQAMSVGGDVTIPTAGFAARVAGTDLGNKMMPHMRLDPSAMSAQQAEQYATQLEQRKAEALAIMEESGKTDTKFVDEARVIERDTRAQLEAAGRDKKQAKFEATIYRDMIVVAAAREKMTPAEYQAKHGLRGIIGPEGQQSVAPLDQADQFDQAGQRRTDTAQFREYFGNSKVVDEKGQPLVVYHGTDSLNDYSQFVIGPTGEYGRGVYFTTSTDRASEYAGTNVGARIIPVYVSIQNPLIANKDTFYTDVAAALGESRSEFMESAALASRHDGTKLEDFVTMRLKEVGHDGVIVNVSNSEKYIVAFSPEQAKSVNNQGAWDRTKPGLMEQASQFNQTGQRKTDTPEFKTWSNNAPVINKQQSETHQFVTGSPIVVEALHGSIQRGLRRFDTRAAVEVPGAIFFTNNDAVAEQYTFERAYGDIISEEPVGEVIRAYVAFNNPMVYSPKGKIVDAIEMGRAIKQAKEAGHDGLIIQNIDDSIGMTGDMGNVYVTWNPTNIKSTDNSGAFSRATADIYNQAAVGPRLMAVHNLSADNLAFAERMGGLAVPSIGVVTEQAGGVESFGEITLIGSREMADPSTSRVFEADAYTARFPEAEWPKVSVAKADKLVKRIRDVAQKYGDSFLVDVTFDGLVNQANANKVSNYWMGSPSIMALFLQDKGIEVEPSIRTANTLSGLDWDAIDFLRPFYEAVNQNQSYDEMEASPEYAALRNAYADAVRAKYAPIADEMPAGRVEKYATEFGPGTMSRLQRDMQQTDRKKISYAETLGALELALRPYKAEFKAWVDKTIKDQFGPPFLRVGKLKKPYTLGNIVDVMTSARVKGKEKGMTFGAGAARAAASKEFVDLEQMREAASKAIVDPDQYSEESKKSSALLESYRNAMVDYTTLTDWRGQSDTWAALDGSMRAIAKYGKRKRKSEKAMRDALRRENFDVSKMPPELIDQAIEAANALYTAPVPYFEAKPQRAVGLKEFKGAVIPSNASAETRSILERNNIPFVEYGSEQTRTADVRKFVDLLERGGRGVFFQSGVTPAFYSALEREVAAIDSKALTAAGWSERIKGLVNKGAIKAEELEWSGLNDYLKMQEGKVSKDTVLEFLRGNGVRVEQETMNGSAGNIDELQNAVARAQEAHEAALDRENAADRGDDEAAAIAATAAATETRQNLVRAEMALKDAERGVRAKYQRYTLPGGTNYREVLLTLPRGIQAPAPAMSSEGLAAREAIFAKYAPKLAELEREMNSLMFAGRALTDEEAQRMADVGNERDQLEEQRNSEARATYKIPERADSPEFATSHWSQRNVLVHLRMNDRLDADGKRVLFVEEVQSDWGQQGRKFGFEDSAKRNAAIGELPAAKEKFEKLYGEWSRLYAASPEQAKALQPQVDAQRDEVERLEGIVYAPKGISRAPFVENTGGWLNLGLKQIMLEAVRGGYDRVAFVNGEQSKDRYDLSKQVSRIVYQDNSSGGISKARMDGPPTAGTLTAYNLDGEQVINKRIDDPAELEDYVGKEVAQRLLEATPKQGRNAGLQTRSRELSGLDLQVGGEGMQDFYNNIVPAAMNKLLKKYGGDQLKMAAMGSGKTPMRSGTVSFESEEAAEDFMIGLSSEGLEEENYGGFDNKVEFTDVGEPAWTAFAQIADQYNGTIDSVTTSFVSSAMTKQLAFDITPEMLKKLESGLPLFQAVPERGPARGGYDPSRLTILLNSKSDASTFWHELGHWQLDVMSRMAADGTASVETLADLDTMYQWFGIAGNTPQERIATWNSMSVDQQRPHHEALTYNFEIYAVEGKAPSIEMQGVFERLASFIKRVYVSIRDDLNALYRQEFGKDLPILTGEVREVMDRMLASDEQIKRKQAMMQMVPLFLTQEESGMDDATYAAYQQMNKEAEEAAVTDLTKASLRQMQWLSSARSGVLKELQAKHDELRKKTRAEIMEQVKDEPVYAAMSILKTGEGRAKNGELVKFDDKFKLNLEAVKKMVPEEQVRQLGYGKYGMVAEDGIAPDMVAEMVGFGSGDELVLALLAAKPLKEEVNARTDKRMMDEHGELNTPQAMEEAVQRALHNEARARFNAVEVRWLSKATAPVKVFMDAAKLAAQQIVAGKVIRDLRPSDHQAAEAKAARDAADAHKSRRTAEQAAKAAETKERNVGLSAAAAGVPMTEVETAAAAKGQEAAQRVSKREAEYKAKYGDRTPQQVILRAKQIQLLQNQLAREAQKAKDEISKAAKDFRKFFKADDKLAKTRNMDLVDAARAILSAFGFGKSDKSPAEYIDKLKAYNPEMYAAIEPLVMAATSGSKNYKDLTVEQFRQLREVVGVLWEQSRRDKLVEIDGKMVALADVVGELETRLDEIGVPDVVAGERGAPTVKDRAVRGFYDAKAVMRRMEHWADATDGAAGVGPFTKYIWRPIKDAVNAYRIDRNKYVKKYVDLLKQVVLPEGKIESKELDYTFGNANGGIGKAELLGALMHTGNDSNKKKLLVGRGWGSINEDGTLDSSRWDAFVARMIKQGVLTKSDFDFVQATWDLLEEVKPIAQKAHRSIFGFYFKEVQATQFTNEFGTFRGGYVPAKTDAFIVRDAQRQSKMEELESDFRNSMPSTGMGFTKGRVEYNKPLSMDVRLVVKHIDDVLRFAHIQPAIKDVLRIFKNRSFSDKLSRMDPTVVEDMVIPWLNRAARQMTSEPGRNKAVDKFWKTVRSRTGVSIMAANLRNAMQQVTGLFPSALKVSKTQLGNALMTYMGSPFKTAEEVASMSTFMNERLQSQIFDMQDDINDILLNPNAYNKVQKWTQKHSYFLQSAFQNMVDVVTWTAKYNQVLAESKVGASDTKVQREAVQQADAAVRLTQGSMSAEDISAFEVGTPFYKTFNQFTGYFNMLANLNTDEYIKVIRDLGWRGNKGKLLNIYMLGFMAPTLVADAIARSMGGGWDDDDDGYLDDVMDWFFGGQARAGVSMVPFGSTAATALTTAFNNKAYDDRITSSPSIAALEASTIGVGKAIINLAEDDKELTGKNVRDVMTLISVSTGIPVTVLGRPAGYLVDVNREKVRPTGPIDVARGLVTGVASSESKKK